MERGASFFESKAHLHVENKNVDTTQLLRQDTSTGEFVFFIAPKPRPLILYCDKCHRFATLKTMTERPKVHYRILTPEMIQSRRFDDNLRALKKLCFLLAVAQEIDGEFDPTMNGISNGMTAKLRPFGLACIVAEIAAESDAAVDDEALTVAARNDDDAVASTSDRRILAGYCMFYFGFTFR